MAYSGWELSDNDRSRLLALYPPVYPDVIAHHVTYQFPSTTMPPSVSAKIVGYVDDGEGVQALVVEIDGETEKANGSAYHITWSIDKSKGRKPVDSNTVIQEFGWKTIPEVQINLAPKVFK